MSSLEFKAFLTLLEKVVTEAKEENLKEDLLELLKELKEGGK